MSFRMDWLDLLAVQGTLKSLLWHHSSKASIHWPSAYLMVQLSHAYMTTGKTIALTRWTFVSKVMSVLFNTLSSFVIAFLQRNKHVLISWLQLPSSVILESKKIKSVTVSIVSSLFPHQFAMKCWDCVPWVMFWLLSFKPAFSLYYFTFTKRLFTFLNNPTCYLMWCAHLVSNAQLLVSWIQIRDLSPFILFHTDFLTVLAFEAITKFLSLERDDVIERNIMWSWAGSFSNS